MRRHTLRHMRPRLVIKAAQDMLAPVILPYMHPKSVENAGEFRSDITAAHHQRPLGQFLQVEHLVRGDRQFRARQLRHERPGPGRDQHMLGGEPLARRQPHRMGILQHRPAVMDRHPRRRQHLAIGRLQPVQIGLQSGAKARPVERGLADIPAKPPRLVKDFGKFRGVDHQLFRHTAANDAGAAHPAFLGQPNLRPTLGSGNSCRPHAARAATDHEKVIVESQVSPPYRGRCSRRGRIRCGRHVRTRH